MIRLRYSCIATLLICVALGIFGAIHRPSYTNESRDPDFMDSLYVAEIPENLAAKWCAQMAVELPKCRYIFRVRPLEGIDYQYGHGRQKVEIAEVYSGEGINIGDEIYILSENWGLVLDDKIKSVEMGFVNVPQKEYEYLVFCTAMIDSVELNTPTFQIYGKYSITPVFCCAEMDNAIIEPHDNDMGTYVLYSEVKENEFFAATEYALEVWLALKEEMLRLFPAE